jgi:hypothetical protein
MPKIEEFKLKIESWDESTYREFPDGRKFTRADVVLSGTEDSLAAGTFDSLMYYHADGTTTYVTLMHLTATLDGRTGSFVLQGDGTFDGTTARAESHVVAGSGTDGLAGLSGIAHSASTHADYPHMPLTLEYDVE